MIAKVLVLLTIVATGCGENATGSADATQDVDIVRPGIIRYSDLGGPEDVLELPSTMHANESFPITVVTYGGGCETAESMEVSAAGDGADLRPFDRTFIPAGNGCAAAIFFLEHHASLQFETPGIKTLTVFGRRVTPQIDEATQIEVTILVE